MDSFEERKSYVVYTGRRPGVYYSWIDCFVQVNSFAESACERFNTPTEALMAWDSYCKSCLNVRREIVRVANMNEDASARLMAMIGPSRYGSEFVFNDTSNPHIAQWNTKVEEKIIDGKKFYRFRASLRTPLIGIPPVSVGRYALDENEAREDVAVLLLQRLKAASGMRIIDFNYHNVIWMEDYIRKLECDMEELLMMNATLAEEMRILQNKK